MSSKHGFVVFWFVFLDESLKFLLKYIQKCFTRYKIKFVPWASPSPDLNSMKTCRVIYREDCRGSKIIYLLCLMEYFNSFADQDLDQCITVLYE